MLALCGTLIVLLASTGKVQAQSNVTSSIFGIARLSAVIETVDTPFVTSAEEARDEALGQYRSETKSAINDFLNERLFDVGDILGSVVVGDIQLGEGSTNDTLTFTTKLTVPSVAQDDEARDLVQERLDQNNLGNAEGLSSLNGIFITKIGVENIQAYFRDVRDVTVTASGSMIRMSVGAVLCMLLCLALMS
ncbi:hypothetical protein DUNSADRAFT_10783 [Dunaliella salina]|uniref:Uncharacterized protein n=1 Tax=Dunaliella salina TaxID=3046 RepID=A0ABQ7GEM9_DUNSA|nr:hypothetical protein DUNSADRAFT_10783 [Dunaliella salina]|eukprot:KAF5833037.1 hypothetical protein DUNSADRAFT_10783 [Dunaliella salina]